MATDLMVFNVNKNILVKLTQLGYQHLANERNKYVDTIPNWEYRDAEYYASKADANGYTNFQAWTFIEYFGKVTSMALPSYYDTNILICQSDLEPLK